MNRIEFSNEFDVLYNNIKSDISPGLNEYEKSVLLTKAQNEIVRNYFNPLGNKYGEGFDDSAKRQIDFSELIKIASLKDNTITTILSGGFSFDRRAKNYKLPEDLLLIVNESIEVTRSSESGLTLKQVIPIKFDEYMQIMSRPYKEPLKHQAWRLVSKGSGDNNINSEIITRSGDNIEDYKLRYVKRPNPIILTDLNGDYDYLTIDGKSSASDCELHPIIHREILDRAIELAKVAYLGDVASTIEINKRNE